jgi:hypothetical protein
MHPMRAGVHSTLGSSPGNLVFCRDMFLNIPLIADWHTITQRREHLIHENLMREKQKRRGYDYAPQQIVLNSLTAIRFQREQKVPSCRIPMVGIVQKVPSTTNTTIHKHHHHGRAVCLSYGVGLMDPPDPMQVTSSERVGQGRCRRVSYKSIN